MKTLLFAAFVFLCSACVDEILEIQDTKLPVTRSVIDEPSTSNPSLLTDWEHQEEVILCNGRSVTVPWSLASGIISNREFANDVKKEDGWLMFYHTFRGLNYYPNMNYMVFYNELTGFLKIFYFNEANFGGPNGALWYFCNMDGLGTSLFNLNSYIALPDNATNKNSFVSLSNALRDPSTGLQPGWNGFEMEVPYTKDYVNLLFAVSTYNKSLTSYTFSGTTESKIEGTIVKTVAGSNGIFKAISSIAGQGAKSWIDKLKTKADSGLAEDTTGTVKAKLGGKILNALSKVSGEGYKSALLNGLKFIFGSSTVTETQDVHLTANGTINMNGTSIDVSAGAAMPMGNLPWYEIANTHNALTGGRYLGVWTLKDTPIVYISRYSRVTAGNMINNSITTGTLFGPYLLIRPVVEVEVNPNLVPYITKQFISTELISCEMLDGGRFDNDWFSSSLSAPLIYSDRSVKLVESPIGNSFRNPSKIQVSVPSNYDYFYDWGTELKENTLLVVTVELTYNYKGKEHKIASSRTYRPKCIVDEASNNQILKSGRYKKPYVINTWEYPFGQ